MSKKKKCPEFENHERWLVSYADMLTLLFAVFVTLYALKEEGEKSQDAAGSLQESFSKPLEDIPSVHRIGPKENGFGIFENLQNNSIKLTNTESTTLGQEDIIKIIEEESNKVRMQLEERLYGPNKIREQTDPGNARIVSIQPSPDGFKLNLVGRHFYDVGSIHIKKAARKDLDMIIIILKELGRKVTVEGHTDSLRSSKRDNWDLSTLRATNVLKYMISKHNFPPTLLSAVGYADTKPMASNNTSQGRAFNRRLEFKVKYDRDSSLSRP